MLSSNTFKLNPTQAKELAKAFFNAGNLSLGTMIFSQMVSGLDISLFILGLFCFTSFFAGAILLLKERDNV